MKENRLFVIERYAAERRKVWDDFVKDSRNATFLLERGYMDYHADRFADLSLMIWSVAGNQRRLAGLFAACQNDDETVSAHGGLTYGGLILPYSGADGADIVVMLSEILAYFRNAGYKKLRYKTIPHIFHRYPSEEDVYAIFRCGGRLAECNLSSTVLLDKPIEFNENSRRNMRRAQKSGVTAEKSNDYKGFWLILEALLAERYGAKPVHGLAEITMLAERFPENIELHVARNAGGEIIAGTVLYVTPACIHTQYIAASAEGKACGALCLLFHKLISERSGEARYFDFGTSNENHGLALNEGLLHQKYAMGGRGVAYNIYDIDL
ncbi:MAG: GNAT family N-acetyltransferase [Muribaculaceae bacterium]|nr:GNAT family N-acetyltransferase [Muribaculaceae bacterium]